MKLVEIELSGPDSAARGYEALETGNILFFPAEASGLTQDEKKFLLGVRMSASSLHKNIAYRPAQDRISGFQGDGPEMAERLRSALRSYSQWAIRFAGGLLPRYRDQWRLDYASFRPLEEQGRDLSWKKRNDLLHVDAFPSRPTQGDLILRLFTNINPTEDRVWVTSEPFEWLASRYAADAGWSKIARDGATGLGRARFGFLQGLRAAGLPVAARSPYDRFMLGFHDFLKGNEEYQKKCPKYQFAFPPGSTWMVFTDVVPHSVLSGQFAIEQTFIIGRKSLAEPARAPAAILETIR